MYSCFDIANYFLKIQDSEVGELISNMKLQKLVYYAQGLYLVLKDEHLFPEKIYAWKHGPVCKPLYELYKSYGRKYIVSQIEDSILALFDEETKSILNMVYENYGKYSAIYLSRLTHQDPPWKNRLKKDLEISHYEMKQYFLEQIREEDPFFQRRAWNKPDSIMNTQRITGDFIYYKKCELYDK